jgi:hypothetical protein
VTSLLRTSIAALVFLWIPAASAGVGSLRSGTGLVLLEDVTRYRVLPDRIEASESVKLKNEGKTGSFLLGLPAGKLRPQDVVVRRGQSSRPLKVKLRKGGPGKSSWLAFQVKIAAGATAELEVTWWQPHGAVEHYGYWRLALVDPLWSAGTFRGAAGRVERQISFAPGVAYVSSSPEASGEGEDWERHDRAYSKKDYSPDSDAKLSLRYRLTAGARSPCSGAKPWEAFDGDSGTAWKPSGCPADDAYLEISAGCRGVGTHDADCSRRLSKSLVLGATVQTGAGTDKQPVSIEGWWGPRRVWAKKGRVNRRVKIMQKKPVTRLRIVFPAGPPASGVSEVNLARLDLERSPLGAGKLFSGRGQAPVRADDNCHFTLVFVNPFALRHITMLLQPRKPPRDWMVATECAGGRGEETYAEPVPHHSHGPGGHKHKPTGKEFKRKHPDRIELDTDHSCMVKKLQLETITTFCTGRRPNPKVPGVRLVF